MIFYIFFIFKSSAAVICVMTPTSTGEHYNFTVEAGLLRGTSRNSRNTKVLGSPTEFYLEHSTSFSHFIMEKLPTPVYLSDFFVVACVHWMTN